MRVAILAGGLGTRLTEETSARPKPMIEIGGYPMIWHIMNIYAHYGLNQFLLALGYKGEIAKDYFLRYQMTNSDVTVNLRSGVVEVLRSHRRDWEVRMIDTGTNTPTGGRLARLEPQLRNNGTFLLTYGDGVSNVNIAKLLEFHRSHGRIATVTVVRPPARFGTMTFDGDRVTEFREKAQTSEGWINGGFFVFEPEVFDYLEGADFMLESEPLEWLAADGELMAFRHEGFWQCMDTLRDRQRLEAMWETGHAPWKVWS